jgi:lysophospholipase L1-like esterase
MSVDLARQIQQQLRRERYPWPVRMGRASLLAVIVTGVILSVLEICVRIFSLAPVIASPREQRMLNMLAVRQLNAHVQSNAFEPDDWLLWKLRTDGKFLGHRVSALGTLPPLATQPSALVAPASLVLVLGDDLTACGGVVFPDVVQRWLNAATLGRPIRVVNASVPGYSSEQLRRWARGLGRLRPSAVFIGAGAADGSPSFGLPDSYLGTTMLTRALADAAVWSHLVRVAIYGTRPTQEKAMAEGCRVSLARYAENLRELIVWARKNHSRPILLTRPFSMEAVESSNSETTNALLVFAGQQLRSYNEVTRRVALETGTELLDLEQEFQKRPAALMFEPGTQQLSPAGHNHAARLVISALRRASIITNDEFNKIVSSATYDTAMPDRPQVKWEVTPSAIVATSATATIRFDVLAWNTGNTTWLRPRPNREEGRGSTWLKAWISPSSQATTDSASSDAAYRWALTPDIHPGELTSHVMEIQPPREPGDYTLRIGLDIDGIGQLSRFGAQETTVSLTVR